MGRGKCVLLTAGYINTKQNVVADRLSRDRSSNSDFLLSEKYFHKVCKKFWVPGIDLFASHVTSKCAVFYSFKPDPYAIGVDAFTFTWEDRSYAFPPYNLLSKVLNKIKRDGCNVLVIAPFWKTQPWFPLYKKMAISEIIILGPNKTLLFDPYRNNYVSPNKKLSLMAAVLSGKSGTI